jgi:hypothetical protein
LNRIKNRFGKLFRELQTHLCNPFALFLNGKGRKITPKHPKKVNPSRENNPKEKRNVSKNSRSTTSTKKKKRRSKIEVASLRSSVLRRVEVPAPFATLFLLHISPGSFQPPPQSLPPPPYITPFNRYG